MLNAWAKRALDLTAAVVGIVLFLPIFFGCCVLIKLDSPGGVFFRQVRVGQRGRLFRIVKLRTMIVGAVSMGSGITAAGDNRITKVGRMLRRTKLDEIPQLWNVLIGDMSIVGPRPEIPKYVALYTAEQRRVLDLRPGITDEASIEFLSEERQLAAAEDPEKYYVEYCIPRKIQINTDYAGRSNVIRDFGVIFRTIKLIWL